MTDQRTQTPARTYLSGSFLQVLLRYIAERQLTAENLCARLKELASHQLIESRVFSELLTAILRLDPVPALGLRIGKLTQPQDFGVVGHLLISCNTLSQALNRYGRYQNLVQTNLNSKVTRHKDIVRHQWSLEKNSQDIDYEFSVATFLNLIETLISKPITPTDIALPFSQPDNPEIYHALLGCPVTFDAPCLQVGIPSTLLLMNISTRDPYLLRLLDRQAIALLDQDAIRPNQFEQFLNQLRQQIIFAMKDGDTRASSVAKRMGYSLRSFYRKLNDNNHRYRTILADTRLKQARRYLADSTLSPSDVAMLLGYSEQSAFIRAFKGWTGITPGEFRQQMENKIYSP